MKNVSTKYISATQAASTPGTVPAAHAASTLQSLPRPEAVPATQTAPTPGTPPTLHAAPDDRCWYAMRVIGSMSYVMECLRCEGVETYSTTVVPRIMFIRADASLMSKLPADLYGKAVFYRNPDRTAPQQIDDRQMNMFIAVTSTPDTGIIQLDIPDPEFFVGQRVRVTGGIFEGAEGVVKRIKGDRRLLIHISGVCAIATPFIHPALLEPM